MLDTFIAIKKQQLTNLESLEHCTIPNMNIKKL